LLITAAQRGTIEDLSLRWRCEQYSEPDWSRLQQEGI